MIDILLMYVYFFYLNSSMKLYISCYEMILPTNSFRKKKLKTIKKIQIITNVWLQNSVVFKDHQLIKINMYKSLGIIH